MLCLALGVSGQIQPGVQYTGVTLRNEPSGLVIDAVDPRSPAAGQLRPGMRVASVNGVPGEDIDFMDLDLILSGDFVRLGVVDEVAGVIELTFSPEPDLADPLPLFLGLALFGATAIWVRRGLAGEALRPLALPVAAAVSAALLLSPVWESGNRVAMTAGVVLPAAATLLLADGFIASISLPRAWRTAVAAAIATGIALPLAIAVMTQAADTDTTPPAELAFYANLGVALAIGLTLATAAGIAVSSARAAPEQATTHRLDRVPILLAAATPIVTSASIAYLPTDFGLLLPLVWLLVVVVVLQTTARVEVLRLQRDTVVAATEAERARLAADLHDDALQEMSALIRRLDDRGAAVEAEIARSVADRLRDVCGDLRLPILDELGAGPALEWLVQRVAEASGGEVRLRRADSGRPPADVELAFFRIAQEALSNAVTHGAPPIDVAYVARPDAASLSITDHGTGIPPEAASSAPRSGHYGLLNMRQRAEQIGARIDFERAADGGTSIGLRWAPA